MVTASAPGKVYLFGEHAVVFGEPAVPCAIDLRARVTAEAGEKSADPDEVRIHAADLSLSGFTVAYGEGRERAAVDAPNSLAETATQYVSEAVEQAVAAASDAGVGTDAGLDVTVESDIPLAAGLGSSAAVVVATIAAVGAELGVALPPEEIAERSYRVEHSVQDGGASRADTFCSAMGGAVRVEGEDCQTLAAPDLPLVVGHDGGGGDTGSLVAQVEGLCDDYPFARDTVAAIGDLVRHGEAALDGGNVAELGRLMDVNHGLLSALGVSARSLEEMVWAAREAGAHGAKLTGAGGGGCVVALDETDATLDALEYTPACEDAFRADLDAAGVRVEDG